MESLVSKKILFVFPSLELGGAERQGLVLAKHLIEREQAQVEVWGLAGGQRVAEICRDLAIATRVVPISIWTQRSKLALQLIGFAKKIREQRFDVLLPYVTHPNLVCCSIWNWTKALACIWQQRDAGLDRGPSRLEKRAAKLASSFVTNSSSGTHYLTGAIGVDQHRIHLIQNGIQLAPPAEDRTVWRKRMGITDSEFVATMIANLTSSKDHETLLRAWRMVLDTTRTPAVLVLAGRLDHGADRAKSIAFDLKLADRVRFIGPVHDVSGLLNSANLCVFSSKHEGCPNGVLEAMAAGIPVVGTDIPGIREAVGEKGFCFLSPESDHHSFARHILTLMGSEDLRVAAGQHNRERIKNEFSADKMCRSTVELICRVARRSKS